MNLVPSSRRILLALVDRSAWNNRHCHHQYCCLIHRLAEVSQQPAVVPKTLNTLQRTIQMMASVAGFSNHTIGSLDGWPSFPKSILGSLTAHSQTVCLPLPQDLRMRDIERIAKMPHSVAHLLLHLPLLLTLVSVGFYARLWDLRRNHSIDLVPRIPAPMYDRRAMPFAMTKLRWRVIGDYNQLKKKAHYETPLLRALHLMWAMRRMAFWSS